MREVEVLRDQILDWLRRDKTLAPSDIVVLAPEIERYAPYIEAAFGGPPEAADFVPFRIADRSPVAGDAVALAFSRVLDVLRGRLAAPEVADLLDLPPVRARFGIAAEAVETLRERIREAGVRWGADGAHREAVDQPALEMHTWRFGLDRLLLGHAWAGDGSHLFAGTLPVEDLEGSEAEQVGCLADLCETLFAFRERIAGPRDLAGWRDLLSELLEETVRPAWDEAWQAERLRQTLARLVERAEEAEFRATVDLDIVRAELDKALGDERSARGFITGALTFCALVPMRSVPFRNVALLGLSDEAFPRATRRAGFDLIEAAPRFGDAAPREVDRALALEALLAAEERLAITFVGQSPRDNRVLPPSVVVSELLDVAAALVDPPAEGAQAGVGDDAPVRAPAPSPSPPSVAAPETEAARAAAVREALLVRHAIQPFSPHYFSRPEDEAARHFSYAERYVGSARAVGGGRAPAPAFFTQPLAPDPSTEGGTVGDAQGASEAEAEPRTVPVADLARFLENPARFLLQRRLGLYLGADVRPLEGREPFTLAGLERWKVGDALLPHLLAGEEADAAYDRMRATGWLPPGMPGRLCFEDVARDAQAIADAAREHGEGDAHPPLRYGLPVGEFLLTGTLRDLRPEGRLTVSFARAGGKRELTAWIEHLAMLLLRGGAGTLIEADGARIAPAEARRRLPERSILVARDKEGASVVAFATVPDAAARLAELVALLAPGWRWPLPLFANASRTYAEVLHEKKPEPVARIRAGNAFRSGGFGGPHDQDDAYVFQAWGEADPTADEPAAGAALAALMAAGAAGETESGTERGEASGGPSRDATPSDAPALDFAGLAQRVYRPLLGALRELES
jgi:exodeoxyribonuclease V gamma subunit